MLASFVRRLGCRAMTGERRIALERRLPSREDLRARYEEISELGVYLHVPFCRRICPYCPYNKELYVPGAAGGYAAAVRKEIDAYAEILGDRAITSLYIGGGTPTTMLHDGLPGLLEHLRAKLNVTCDVHMESHPDDLSDENLDAICSLGVRHLSVGVEALQDHHLRALGRSYTAQQATRALERAVRRGFRCVNVDLMFALPGQTRQEVEAAGRTLVELGVDQVAAYPIFRFPYTVMGQRDGTRNYGPSTLLGRRRMLRALERIFYTSGYERSSVWAFTRTGAPRYCSVTVPLYLGLGASGGSLLRDAFYLNTFDVAEYVRSMNERGTAIALSLELSERMQMAAWLYWRIYETRISKSDFETRFGRDFDHVYGKCFAPLRRLGYANDDGQEIVLTDRGSYWLHVFEDLFSIDYVSKLWGTSKREPWPESVLLHGAE